MKKHFNKKNFSFYWGAFISIYSIETIQNAIIALVVSILSKLLFDVPIFMWIFIPLEIVSIIDALVLTFSNKKDPWGKE